MMKKAFCLNIAVFVLILFSVIWMFSGLHFGDAPVALAASKLSMLKYYTVDSNIIMGLVALFLCAGIRHPFDRRCRGCRV